MFVRLFGLAVIMAAGLQLVACSTYNGKVTNAPAPTSSKGLPLLTQHYAP